MRRIAPCRQCTRTPPSARNAYTARKSLQHQRLTAPIWRRMAGGGSAWLSIWSGRSINCYANSLPTRECAIAVASGKGGASFDVAKIKQEIYRNRPGPPMEEPLEVCDYGGKWPRGILASGARFDLRLRMRLASGLRLPEIAGGFDDSPISPRARCRQWSFPCRPVPASRSRFAQQLCPEWTFRVCYTNNCARPARI